jgi:hypothetical protein
MKWLDHLKSLRTAKPEQYLFVVAYGRSGSTLLQSILASIPGCHMAGENADALGGLFATWRSAQEARREQGSMPRTGAGDPWRGAHLIEPDHYNRRLASVFLEEIVRPPRGARFIGFKEVRYFDYDEDRLLEYLDYIRETFQPCFFIFNRRSGEEVANSGWWVHETDDIRERVRRFDHITDEYVRAHEDVSIVVDYTEWRSDPTLLKPLFDRLGVEFQLPQIKKILARRLSH